MPSNKARFANTDPENLISNLRGEVGEVVTSWILLRALTAQVAQIRSDDPSKDLENEELSVLSLLVSKLEDEIVARLAELASDKSEG